jgi:CRISPR/Cas system CSM-associated protein Csm4 (group 5 of RAMP superfamily)
VIPGNSQDPPTGPKQWREKMARKQQWSIQSKTAKKNNQTPNTKLQQLEADILDLKENIRHKEQARKGSDTYGSSQSNGNEWRVANRKRPANRKTQTLRIQGKYKLVIGSSDDGTRADVTTIQQVIERIAC